MKLKQLSEVIYTVYSDGRPKATAVTFSEELIGQMCILALGEISRTRFYDSKKMDDFGDADYSGLTPLLSRKRFKLGDTDAVGRRIADLSEFDLIRRPNNSHIVNVYPVGTSCNGEAVGEITQVAPGEENFYLSSDFASFQFFVPKGRQVHVYHVNSCIKEIEVETTFVVDDIDVSLDMAFEISTMVLTTAIKVNGVPIKLIDNNYSPQPTELKRKLQEAENQ